MEIRNPIYIWKREEWRMWLEAYFETEKEVWLIYPKKASGKPRIVYNDAVEEALCFGWIDSTVKSFDSDHSVQRFSPRRKGSAFSQPNKERIKWLAREGLIHPSIRPGVQDIVEEEFVFPQDIIDTLKADPEVWSIYEQLSEGYRRLRVGYIDSARDREEEFDKRLAHFMNVTRQGKQIKGYGGIEKYY